LNSANEVLNQDEVRKKLSAEDNAHGFGQFNGGAVIMLLGNGNHAV
jgi:hypothetical protein